MPQNSKTNKPFNGSRGTRPAELETQALDLYLRFAHRSDQPQTREILFTRAGEEKAHLASLGRLLEEKSGQRG
jgi:rubrerythrin